MKYLLFVILIIFITACSDKNLTDPAEPTNSTVKIPFRTHRHSSILFSEEPVNPLVILRSLEEEQQFIDTTRPLSSTFSFSSYDDSLLIVLRSPYHISVSNHFAIDSLVADTLLNVLTVHAHNFFPISKMSLLNTHCHIVAIPKIDIEIEYKIIESFETTEGTIIPFNSFLNWDYGSYSGEMPFLVTLNSISEQDSFLDNINLHQKFPEFDYTDSMLVGVFSHGFNHITPFEIVSLIQFGNIIKVFSQYYYVGMLPAPERNYHFVGIENTELPFIMEPIKGFYPWYD